MELIRLENVKKIYQTGEVIVAMMSYPNTKKDMIAYVVLITILVATFISYFVLKEFVLSSLINNGGSTTNFLNNIL